MNYKAVSEKQAELIKLWSIHREEIYAKLLSNNERTKLDQLESEFSALKKSYKKQTTSVNDESNAREQNERMRDWFEQRTGIIEPDTLLTTHMKEIDKLLGLNDTKQQEEKRELLIKFLEWFRIEVCTEDMPIEDSYFADKFLSRDKSVILESPNPVLCPYCGFKIKGE